MTLVIEKTENFLNVDQNNNTLELGFESSFDSGSYLSGLVENVEGLLTLSKFRVQGFSQLASSLRYSGATSSQWNVSVGDKGEVVGLGTYEVLSSGDAVFDFNYTGSGGVKLKLLPNPDGTINLMAFGAVGNNIANDALVFQKADVGQAAGRWSAIYLPRNLIFFCQETTYKPVGDYYGGGKVRFGGDGTLTDTGVYISANVPSPIYARLHRVDSRGRNTIIGADAFAAANKLTSNFLTAVGDYAGESLTDPARTTVVGSWAGRYSTALKYSDAFGASAAQWAWADRLLALGTNAGKWMGDRNPSVSRHDFFNLGSDLDDPADDDPEVWEAKGFESVLRFVRSLYLDGTTATVYSNPAIPAANQIISMGNARAAILATTLDQVRGNVAIGRDSLIHALKSASSTGVGYKALAQGIDLTRTTALGRSAGEMGLWHEDGVFVGQNAGWRAIVTENTTIVGARALQGAYSAKNSVVIGTEAGADIPQTILTNNTTFNIDRAVLIGSGAAQNALDVNNSVIIGYRAGDDSTLNLNGKMFIGSGSSSTTTPTIGGDIGSRALTINRPVLSTTGAKLHINEGLPLVGATTNTSAEILVLESDDATGGGLTILTPSTASGNIFFADPTDNNTGRIQYDHADNTLSITTNDVKRVVVGADSTFNTAIKLSGPSGLPTTIRRNQTAGRDEAQFYAHNDAYDAGSDGAGIHVYGNNDNEHAGNIAFLTGQSSQGTARMIISGGSDNVANPAHRTNTDTRVSIGNSIWDFVDNRLDTGMFNLFNPINRPAIYIEGASASEGEIAVEPGGRFDAGHWDGTTFTSRLAFNGSGGLQVNSGTPLLRLLSATAILNFPSIAAAASSDLTVTVTGALVGDSVSLGLPAAPAAGIVFNAFVSATNTVTVRAINITAAAVDPVSATYRATVLGL